jgi:hypothetical protein
MRKDVPKDRKRGKEREINETRRRKIKKFENDRKK